MGFTGATTVRNIALCYVRRSFIDKDDPGTLDSVKRQQFNCIAEAERRGWLPEPYPDAEGFRSGRYEHTRPGWLNLKAQLDRPDVAAVIVETLSRASRSVRDLYNFLAELERREIALVSIKENIDTSTAMGRAFVGFIAVMNQFESDIASERMTASIEFKRENLGRHWGLTPFGCDREGTDHVLVPTKAGSTVDGVWRGYHEALVKIYGWYAAGDTGFSAIVDRLNDSGYRFRDRHGQARLFNRDDVRRILDANRIYAGYVPLGAAKDRSGTFFKGSHSPILPLELCDRVAEMLGVRQALVPQFVGRPPVNRTYLLTPLIYCAACGKQMAGMFQDGQRWYRHLGAKRNCQTRGQILADTLEQQVLDRLAVFNMPDVLKERIKALARQMAKAQKNPEVDEARARVRTLQRKLENLKELRIEGELKKPEYEQRKKEYTDELIKEQAKLRRVPSDVCDIEDLLPKIDRIAEVIRGGSSEHKKQLYQTMFERIEQRDGHLTQVKPREWAKPFFSGSMDL